MLAPVCLFTYNRIEELAQTIDALKSNYLAKESALFVFSDGPKKNEDIIKVASVRKLIREISGFKEINIIESDQNKGLANSIITGVSKVFERYKKVIVLEDDLVTSPNFLSFMNQALDFYEPEQKIQSINGYSLMYFNVPHDAYFQTRTGSWGWGTWSNRWDEEIFNKEKIKGLIKNDPLILQLFDNKCGKDMAKMLMGSLSEKNDSWYVRWAFDHFRKNTYAVFPKYSFVKNIGYGNDATHTKGISNFTPLDIDPSQTYFKLGLFQIPDTKLSDMFLFHFTWRHKILLRLKLLLNKRGRKLLLKKLKTSFDL